MMRRIIPWIMFLVMEISLISLGVWQLQRRDWKETLLAAREKNAALPAFMLTNMTQVTPDMEYRRVNLICTYLDATQHLVEGFDAQNNIATRPYVKCRAPPNIVVDLGWDPPKPAMSGNVRRVTISGRIRHWAGQSKAQALGGIVPVGPQNFAAPVAPFYVQSGDALPPPPANNHFAYAMQWFIFAGVLLVIFTIWVRRQRLAPLDPGA